MVCGGWCWWVGVETNFSDQIRTKLINKSLICITHQVHVEISWTSWRVSKLFNFLSQVNRFFCYKKIILKPSTWFSKIFLNNLVSPWKVLQLSVTYCIIRSSLSQMNWGILSINHFELRIQDPMEGQDLRKSDVKDVFWAWISQKLGHFKLIATFR